MNCFCIDFFAVKRRENSNNFASIHCSECLQLKRWISYKEYVNFYPKIKQGELDILIKNKYIKTNNLVRK